MRLFLVTRSDEPEWDEFVAVLVRAENAFDAARWVLGPNNDGAAYYGMTEHNIVITPVKQTGERGQVIADFKAG
ncbi:hypothetical protein [Streptomyces sp. NPDC003832]